MNMNDKNTRYFTRYQKALPALLIAVCFATATAAVSCAPCVAYDVAIVVGTEQEDQATAANELADYLHRIYPSKRFEVVANHAKVTSPKVIRIGTKQSWQPGTYTVQSLSKNELTIEGADIQGLRAGIYALLEKLGCGFYLSFETVPKSLDAELDFSKWNVKNESKVPARIIFNWHNFLSGCSTWQLEDWTQWIDNSQKMGYNGVMVHAYGNNPIAGFQFEGIDKPVGFLSSTKIGRDWATNHVNDVRLLYGGDVFKEPVFGCEAAVNGSDAQRTAAAKKLMSPVFEHAQQRGVDVYFAVDVDTTMANPQEQIKRLPEHARFLVDVSALRWMGQKAQKMHLPNPDTPEGYGYYKAQVAELLKAYPGIDCLVVWHRRTYTPWMGFKVEEMPKKWQEEFQVKIAKTPEMKERVQPHGQLVHHRFVHHHFALSKVVKAFQRAVRELGREEVKIAYGSWGFNFLPTADLFMPKEVTFIPLDYEVLHNKSQFDTVEQRIEVAKTAKHRNIIPITWAHHDDGNYVGRSYKPYENFYDKLKEMGCDKAGFGIIHWTTKPLDLYFKSLTQQVHENTLNQPLEATCRRMAIDMVGPQQADPMSVYLVDWVTTMPKIGRETGRFFIDHKLSDYEKAMQGFSRRRAILNRIDSSALAPQQAQWVDYFRGLEQFIRDVYKNEALLQDAKKAYKDKDLEAARKLIQQCKPEEVIENFARFSKNGKLSRGEKGLIVTMNTRWLPYYVQLRQCFGLEPIRINFGPTSHDPLAQSPGIYTFHFDDKKQVWQTLGLKETKNQAFVLSGSGKGSTTNSRGSVLDSGVEVSSLLKMSLSPILDKRSPKLPLPPGRYRLAIHSDDQPYLADVRWRDSKSKESHDFASIPLLSSRISQNHTESVRDLVLKEQSSIWITIQPKEKPVRIYAITLTPIADNSQSTLTNGASTP